MVVSIKSKKLRKYKKNKNTNKIRKYKKTRNNINKIYGGNNDLSLIDSIENIQTIDGLIKFFNDNTVTINFNNKLYQIFIEQNHDQLPQAQHHINPNWPSFKLYIIDITNNEFLDELPSLNNNKRHIKDTFRDVIYHEYFTIDELKQMIQEYNSEYIIKSPKQK